MKKLLICIFVCFSLQASEPKDPHSRFAPAMEENLEKLEFGSITPENLNLVKEKAQHLRSLLHTAYTHFEQAKDAHARAELYSIFQERKKAWHKIWKAYEKYCEKNHIKVDKYLKNMSHTFYWRKLVYDCCMSKHRHAELKEMLDNLRAIYDSVFFSEQDFSCDFFLTGSKSLSRFNCLKNSLFPQDCVSKACAMLVIGLDVKDDSRDQEASVSDYKDFIIDRISRNVFDDGLVQRMIKQLKWDIDTIETTRFYRYEEGIYVPTKNPVGAKANGVMLGRLLDIQLANLKSSSDSGDTLRAAQKCADALAGQRAKNDSWTTLENRKKGKGLGNLVLEYLEHGGSDRKKNLKYVIQGINHGMFCTSLMIEQSQNNIFLEDFIAQIAPGDDSELQERCEKIMRYLNGRSLKEEATPATGKLIKRARESDQYVSFARYYARQYPLSTEEKSNLEKELGCTIASILDKSKPVVQSMGMSPMKIFAGAVFVAGCAYYYYTHSSSHDDKKSNAKI